MKSDDVKAALMLAATGAAAFIIWRAWRGAGNAINTAVDSVTSAAQTVGGWVNPVADTNLAYQGVNSLGSWVTGDVNYNLGGATYDAVQEVQTWSANPASTQNPYYLTVNALGEKVTGDQNWTLGGAIYDAVNPAPVFSGTSINAAAIEDARRVAIASGGGGNFTGTGTTGSW